VLVVNHHVVDAGAAGSRDLGGLGGEHVAAVSRREEVDGQAGGHRELIARVAREGEGRIRERGDEAAMADVVAVEHVVAHAHLEPGSASAESDDAHAQPARGAVGREHVGADGLGRRLLMDGGRARHRCLSDP
jgi:hypothetical protein